MIVCVQRVSKASVSVSGELKGSIGNGLYVLVGVESGDTEKACLQLAEKICSLRVFTGGDGKMSLSALDIDAEMLIISQFTLAGNTSKGNRPDFGNAEKPERALKFYNMFVNKIRSVLGADKVATGEFGAHMVIEAVNDGPVTLNLKR